MCVGEPFMSICASINYPSRSDWIFFFLCLCACVCVQVRDFVSMRWCSCLNYQPVQHFCLHMSASTLVWVYECMHQRMSEYMCA